MTRNKLWLSNNNLSISEFSDWYKMTLFYGAKWGRRGITRDVERKPRWRKKCRKVIVIARSSRLFPPLWLRIRAGLGAECHDGTAFEDHRRPREPMKRLSAGGGGFVTNGVWSREGTSRPQLCKSTGPHCQTAEPQKPQTGQAATRPHHINHSAIKLTISCK